MLNVWFSPVCLAAAAGRKVPYIPTCKKPQGSMSGLAYLYAY